MTTPPMMLAHRYDESINPTGWLMSEKLDGIRAWWDGERLLTRLGNTITAPVWFTRGLPKVCLEGELWCGRGRFAQVSSTVRKKVPVDGEWEGVSFRLFDAPTFPGTLIARLDSLLELPYSPAVEAVCHFPCKGHADLDMYLKDVLAFGGEGIMLRHPESHYVSGRSHQLLKVKPQHDAEATVIGYEAGQGKHAGRVGALVVEAGGKRFKLGTGLTDAERAHPPNIGAVVTYLYTELTPAGIPRFPRYWRERTDTDAHAGIAAIDAMARRLVYP